MSRRQPNPCQCGPRNQATRDLLQALAASAGASGNLAARLIEVELAQLLTFTITDFRSFGVSAANAARLIAALELGRRAAFIPRRRLKFECSSDVEDWAQPRLSHLPHEEVWVLALDARNLLKRAARVGQGGVHGCGLQASDILRPAVRSGASAIVLVHNHPSGDPTPSSADIHMTDKVAQAAELMGIPLLDHVVVAREGARSVCEPGALLTRPEACTASHIGGLERSCLSA